MKRVLVYKEVVNELDLISEITKLIDDGMPEQGYNYVEFKLSDLEYLDEKEIFHYAQETCKKAFNALGFKTDGIKDYIYLKDNYKFATVIVKTNSDNIDKFIIQRQS